MNILKPSEHRSDSNSLLLKWLMNCSCLKTEGLTEVKQAKKSNKISIIY